MEFGEVSAARRRARVGGRLAALAALFLAACSEPVVLEITSVSPTSGGPGTVLTVTGTGFATGATATVCGVALEGVSLETDAGAPGTARLTGTVPDLGASAECVVAVVNPGGEKATWDGRFEFQGTGGGQPPANQAPTSTGLPDISVAGDEDTRVIDLAGAFDDPDDGAASLTFAASVTSPAGNVTADVSGATLTLGFPSRFGEPADVTVTATDPHGASLSVPFTVDFAGGEVRFEAPGLGAGVLAEASVEVRYGGSLVASTSGAQVLTLRSGEYSFSAELIEPGRYINRRLRAPEVIQTVAGPGETVVELDLQVVPGSGRLWLPLRDSGGSGFVWSFDDDALRDGLGSPTSAIDPVGDDVSAVARAPDGALWLSGQGDVWRVDPTELDEADPQVTSPFSYSGGWGWVSNLAFDPDGNLWTAEMAAGRVMMFTADQLDEGGSQSPQQTLDVPEVSGLAFDAHGNLWVSGADATNGTPYLIYRYDAADLAEPDPQPALTINARAVNLITPVSDLAFDDAGDLWYTTGPSNPFVGHVPAEDASGSGTLSSDADQGVRLPHNAMAIGFDSRGSPVGARGARPSHATGARPVVPGRDFRKLWSHGDGRRSPHST